MTDSNSSKSSTFSESGRFDSQFQFNAGNSPISAIITNKSSSQLIVGHGGKINFYEFHGMNRECRPYLNVEWNDQIISDMSYSVNNKEFIASSNAPYIRLYASNGDLLEAFVQGDPYLRDLKQTRGHVNAITSCAFYPVDSKKFISSSIDGTIRIWSVEQQRKSLECIRFSAGLSSHAHGRVAVHSACFLNNFIVAGGSDKHIKIWDFESHSVVSNKYVCTDSVSYVIPNPDTQHLIVQTKDDVITVLDKRQLKEPVLKIKDCLSRAKACWSPDGQEIVAYQNNSMKTFDLFTGSVVESYDVDGKPSICYWDSKLDQLIIGKGSGDLEFQYYSASEKKGILFPVMAPAKKSTIETDNIADTPGAIYLPNALPLFQTDPTALLRSQRTTKRELARIRRTDATAAVEKPVDGAGKKGKLGTSNREAIMARVLKDIPPLVYYEDPRDAVEKYKKEEGAFVQPAYNKSQPNLVLHDRTIEEEEEKMPRKKKKRK
eukprot:NODE_235_length_13458_cov_0.279737.p1 type:complete len:490 gc:universal NODE_235_length_13458_cov_0.279737:11484-12953(+)